MFFMSKGTTVDGGGTSWNPSAETSVDWDTDDIIDTNVYTHSESVNQHQVTVDEDGDYLLGFNMASTSAAVRSNTRVKINVKWQSDFGCPG